MLLNIIKNSEMLDSQNMLNINETTNGIYILVKGINIIKNIYIYIKNILKELNKLCILTHNRQAPLSTNSKKLKFTYTRQALFSYYNIKYTYVHPK